LTFGKEIFIGILFSDNYYTKTKIVGIIYVFLIHNVEISSQGIFFSKILGNCWGVIKYLVKQTRPGEQDLDFF